VAIRGDDLRIVRNPALLVLRSLLGVPLLSQDRVIGVLHVGSRVDRVFTEQETELLRLAGDRIALAVEHARLFEREQAIADTLQRSLLPERLPDIPGVTLAARYRPARYQVGGDFYDVFALDDGGWLMVIADVCGKGPQAAAMTALARYTLRAEALHKRSPSALLSALNGAILRQRSDLRFLTAVVAHLRVTDKSEAVLTISLGGHPHPILIDAAGHAREIGSKGTLVGVVPDASFRETAVKLAHGDSVVFYTDGVLEAHAPARPLEPDELTRALAADNRHALAQLAARVEQYGTRGAPDATLRDDIAILALRIAANK
jgi:serine phosphatase RsbU (regulator of sigma subunit)